MSDNNNSNKEKDNKPSTGSGTGVTPPKPQTPPPTEKPVPEAKISLAEFCNSLPKTGVDKYAKSVIEARINDPVHKGITDEPKTRAEWEKVYLTIKKS